MKAKVFFWEHISKQKLASYLCTHLRQGKILPLRQFETLAQTHSWRLPSEAIASQAQVISIWNCIDALAQVRGSSTWNTLAACGPISRVAHHLRRSRRAIDGHGNMTTAATRVLNQQLWFMRYLPNVNAGTHGRVSLVIGDKIFLVLGDSFCIF